jgi:hypothetical protein
MKSLLHGLALAVAAVVAPALAHADISFIVNIAPPVLPIYAQPPIPDYGYIWTPGYWSWSDDDGDYYWVPGTWVVAPFVGALWTPGYWTTSGNRYGWHDGYWGARVGFYGGVNYGYGYGGVGYQGGYWNNGEFRYNRTVNNITTTNITNVYDTTVTNNITNNRVSYNGGVGGIHLQPTATERSVVHMSHMGPTAMQVRHQQVAIANPMQLASINRGLPKVAATPAPAAFSAPNVVAAGAMHNQPANRFYSGSAPYQPTAPQQPPALHPQFQQQLVQQARPIERHTPQENMRQQAVPYTRQPERHTPQENMRQQAVPYTRQPERPMPHESPLPQPTPIPQRVDRPAPQEHGHQQAILRAQPLQQPAPPETAHNQTAVATPVHQRAPHQWHPNEREIRER